MARRRVAALVMAVSAVGALALPASPAQAASCTNVPGSTIGTDVTILGSTYRVPAISNIVVCTDTASAPLVSVSTARNGNCTTACLSVFLQGGEADAGAVTISYRSDGTTHTQSVNPGGVGGGSDTCLFSVGSPDAPYPSCALALGPDGLPGGGNPGSDLPGCESVPDYWDPNSGSTTRFCDDPAAWARAYVNLVRDFCEQGGCSVNTVRCIVLGDPYC